MATSIAVRSADSPEIPAKIAGKSHGSVYDIVIERILAALLLSGAFTYAKNQGVLDGINPVRDAMIPKRAAAPEETHAATLDEVLAIMDVLEKEQEQHAPAAVALMFFSGLRPGESRGVCCEDYDGKRLFVRRSRWRVWTTPPKTESSVKPVPVIEPLGSILGELREADGNSSSGSILRGPSGSPLDLDNLAERVVKPALLRCAVCKRPESKHVEAAVKRWS